MTLTPETVAVLAQLNRETLPDLCTVQHSVPTPTATGGKVPNWQALGDGYTDLPCRASMVAAPREGSANSSAHGEADYVVVLDHRNVDATTLDSSMRIQVASAEGWSLTLYVLAVDGPQSLDAFPKVWCTSQPQPGQ